MSQQEYTQSDVDPFLFSKSAVKGSIPISVIICKVSCPFGTSKLT